MHKYLRMLSICLCIGSVFASDKANIILIMVDDLGYGDISPYGQKKIETPTLEHMSKKGLKFTQFYSGLSVCAPSRASLMQGLHTGHSCIRGNKQNPGRGGQFPIPADTLTIAKALKQAGYATGMIGKWGLGNVGTSGDPAHHGWDLFYGYTDQVLAHNYYPDHLIKNGEILPLKNKPVYLPEKFNGLGSYTPKPKDYSHDFFMEETLGFIEEHANEPFFLYLPYTIPHDNGEQLENMRFEIPNQGIYAKKPWTKEQKDYAAMITYLDSSIQKIIDTTEKVGVDQNTLILFCSDNGPMKHSVTDFFDSNGDLRGAKRDLYEGGIRSPLIAYWPKVIEEGKVSGHTCAAWDFFPTFCEIAGAPVPKGLDGISMFSEFRGTRQKAHEFLYWEFHLTRSTKVTQAVRMGDWKAIRYNAGDSPNGPVHLYNLSNDLQESHNIAKKHPEIVERISAIMKREHSASSVFKFQYE
ncbi:MAG: arylsulfatase [Planctomycetes bacterium]|nr:arylsulfatase [Planctomycetota bacterium]